MDGRTEQHTVPACHLCVNAAVCLFGTGMCFCVFITTPEVGSIQECMTCTEVYILHAHLHFTVHCGWVMVGDLSIKEPVVSLLKGDVLMQYQCDVIVWFIVFLFYESILLSCFLVLTRFPFPQKMFCINTEGEKIPTYDVSCSVAPLPPIEKMV